MTKSRRQSIQHVDSSTVAVSLGTDVVHQHTSYTREVVVCMSIYQIPEIFVSLVARNLIIQSGMSNKSGSVASQTHKD